MGNKSCKSSVLRESPSSLSVSRRPPSLSESKYSKIADNYSSLEEVTAALAQAGLESSNLIVGIDFTRSNEWSGGKSFNNKCLHSITQGHRNPYEQSNIHNRKFLSAFDEDDLIPCFGVGDASTRDRDVFSFYRDGKVCIHTRQRCVQFPQRRQSMHRIRTSVDAVLRDGATRAKSTLT